MFQSNENNDVEDSSDFDSTTMKIEIDGKIELTEEINDKKALKIVRSVIKDYEDYLTVPNRRKSDLNFRNYLTSQTNNINDRMKEIHALLIEKQQMSIWAAAERLINDFASYVRFIEKGDYGFTTFFENPKLLEIDISQLYLIDYDLIETLKMINERTFKFMRIVQQNYFEDLDLWVESLDRLLGRAIRLFDDRAKLIGSYERIS